MRRDLHFASSAEGNETGSKGETKADEDAETKEDKAEKMEVEEKEEEEEEIDPLDAFMMELTKSKSKEEKKAEVSVIKYFVLLSVVIGPVIPVARFARVMSWNVALSDLKRQGFSAKQWWSKGQSG